MRKPKVGAVLKRKGCDQVKDRLDVHVHGIGHEKTLEQILNLVQAIQAQGVRMGEAQDRLKQEVAETKAAVGKILTQVRDISARLKAAIAAGSDETVLTGLSDELDQTQADIQQTLDETQPA